MAANTTLQLRRDTAAQWLANNPTLQAGEMAYETDTGQFKIGNGTLSWGALPYAGTSGPASSTVLGSYGSGLDGNVTVSSGQVVNLEKDMFYNNLTLTGGIIYTKNYRIFVNGTLDITNAVTGSIQNNGNIGITAISSTGGAAASSGSSATLSVPAAATAGAV
jgi:hypothetical protein